MNNEKESDQADKVYAIGAVILVVLLITGSIIYRIKYRIPDAKNAKTTVTNTIELENFSADNLPIAWDIIKPVAQNDHILGNPNASLTLIIYLDIECPFCKAYYKIAKKVIETYGKDGTLRLVFRHSPIKHSHPTAPKEAEASECVAEIGGNNKFWEYLDILIESKTPAINNLTEELATKASSIDVNKEIFKTCLDSNKYENLVAQNSEEAVKMGASGTPFSILVDSKENMLPIPGMLSYQQLEDIIKATKRSSGLL